MVRLKPLTALPGPVASFGRRAAVKALTTGLASFHHASAPRPAARWPERSGRAGRAVMVL